jgi:hypothetical protein
MRKATVVLVVLAVTAVNAWMNWYLWQERQRPVSVAERPVGREVKIKKIGQQKIFRPQRQPLETARPPWSLVESDDYHRYAENLRAIGCPDRTVRDILVADIAANFKEQKRRIWDDTQAEYWLNGDQREARRRERTRSEEELRRTKWRLLRDLFGYPVDEETLKAVREPGFVQAIVWLVFGFQERDQAIRALASTMQHQEQARALSRLAEGILIPSDYQQAKKIRESYDAEITSFIGASGVVETFLRFALVNGRVNLPGGSYGLNLSGEEVRKIAEIQTAAHDRYIELFHAAGFTDLMPEAVPAEEVDAAIARYLGRERYGDYVRAGDERFQNLYSFATDNGLSKKEARRVFNVRDSLEREWNAVNKADLSGEEKVLLQTAIKTRMEKSIDQVFGKIIGKEYREGGDGDWLGKLITVPEEAEVQP